MKATAPRISTLIAATAIAACFGFTGWTADALVRTRSEIAVELAENRERIAIVERSALSPENGRQLRELIARNESAIARGDPPAWIVARLDRLELRIDQLLELVHSKCGPCLSPVPPP